MRVLMFGWEFPPHISGGLGTACFGMTRALASRGADVCFVLPRVNAGGDDGNNFLRMRSASGTPITQMDEERMAHAGGEIWSSRLRCMPVASPLTPYLTPEAYARALKEMTMERTPGGESVLRSQSSYN